MVQLLSAPSLLAPPSPLGTAVAPAREPTPLVLPPRVARALPVALPFLLAGLAGLVYGAFAVLQWRRFEAPSWDLGIFTELARDYGAFRAPVVPIKGPGFDLLGDHFSPILALLGPVWDVFPSPVTLLLVQVLLIALSVVVVTRLAVARLGLPAASAIGAAYAFSFGLQSMVAVQFHEVAFAVPLVALSLAALVSDRPRSAALAALPLLLVKEDLGLTVAVIGVLLLVRGARRWGVVLVVSGVLGTVVVTTLVIPALNPGHAWHYSDSIPLGTYLADPWRLVTALGDPRKVQTLALLAGTAGLVGCRSRLAFAAVPTLLWRFYSSDTGYYGPAWHYSAVLMPIAAIALIDVLSRRTGEPVRRRRWTIGAPVVVALLTGLVLMPQPPIWRLLQPGFSATTARTTSAREALARVPAGRTVESDVSLLAPLAARDDVYYAGTPGIPAPDYSVIDTVAGGWNPPPKDLAAWVTSRFPGHAYRLVFSRDGYEVAERVR